jgi:hypothetical protein
MTPGSRQRRDGYFHERRYTRMVASGGVAKGELPTGRQWRVDAPTWLRCAGTGTRCSSLQPRGVRAISAALSERCRTCAVFGQPRRRSCGPRAPTPSGRCRSAPHLPQLTAHLIQPGDHLPVQMQIDSYEPPPDRDTVVHGGLPFTWVMSNRSFLRHSREREAPPRYGISSRCRSCRGAEANRCPGPPGVQQRQHRGSADRGSAE